MEKTEILDRISRREVLKGAGGVTVASGIIGIGFSGFAAGWEDIEFVIQQGEECVPVEPLQDGDVVDFYGYNPDVSSPDPRQSNTGLEAPGVSRLFLFDGEEGFSLVILQGGDEDEGGAATFLVCGLSAEGRWVVLDDSYEGATDEFHLNDQEAALNWSWGAGGRNDGAVFRGLEENFCVSILPAFNETAELEPIGSGVVEEWQFLSGDSNDPEVIDLDMSEPVTIRTGSCDSEATACAISTETVDDPFTAEVTFCCTSVMVDAEQYNAVSLNFLDGTDEHISGPFEGVQAFIAEDDDDNNPNDEIIRSVVIERNDDRVEVKNPNFDRCRELVEDDDEDYGSGES